MSFLRSSLFSLILSLLVLTGYGHDLLADCRGHHDAQGAQHEKAPGKTDDCQCLCHQVATPALDTPVRGLAPMDVTILFVTHPAEFPPETLPVGIDHPPQLT